MFSQGFQSSLGESPLRRVLLLGEGGLGESAVAENGGLVRLEECGFCSGSTPHTSIVDLVLLRLRQNFCSTITMADNKHTLGLRGKELGIKRVAKLVCRNYGLVNSCPFTVDRSSDEEIEINGSRLNPAGGKLCQG